LLIESAVLIFNGWTCPLTSIAERYTDERQHNFDIYLPEIVAKYNKLIFGTIFVVGLLLVLFNVIKTYA
jgi:polyferredoxin